MKVEILGKVGLLITGRVVQLSTAPSQPIANPSANPAAYLCTSLFVGKSLMIVLLNCSPSFDSKSTVTLYLVKVIELLHVD